jgi:hypothetical protein
MTALASATLVAPSIVPAAGETAALPIACSFPDLVMRFVRVRERNNAQLERDKMGLDDHLVDESGISVPWTEINSELEAVTRKLLARPPGSIIDLAWQAEAISTTDVEGGMFDPEPTAVLAKLVEHIRALAGPLPIADAAAVFVPTRQPDPIFAAIETHKRVVAQYAQYDAFSIQEDKLCAEIPRDRRKTNYRFGEELEVVETDDPRWIAFETELKMRSEAVSDAECELAYMVPTTMQGVIALLQHAVEREGRGYSWPEHLLDDTEPENTKWGKSWHHFVHRNLVESLQQITV